MDNSQQIEQYLEALALELGTLGIEAQYHFVITGGAYLILQCERNYTEDIDFALIAGASHPTPGQVIHTTVQRLVVASLQSTVPYAAAFRQAVTNVATAYHLPSDWMNDEVAEHYYDDAPSVDVLFWRSFEGRLFVYLPTPEYVFATKSWRTAQSSERYSLTDAKTPDSHTSPGSNHCGSLCPARRSTIL